MSRRMRLRRNGRTSVVNVSNGYSSSHPYLFQGVYLDFDPAGCEFVEEVTEANATVSTDVPVSDFGSTSGSSSDNSGYSSSDNSGGYGSSSTSSSYDSGYSGSSSSDGGYSGGSSSSSSYDSGSSYGGGGYSDSGSSGSW